MLIEVNDNSETYHARIEVYRRLLKAIEISFRTISDTRSNKSYSLLSKNSTKHAYTSIPQNQVFVANYHFSLTYQQNQSLKTQESISLLVVFVTTW